MMLSLTGRKPRLLLGVDIGSTAVKLLELGWAGAGFKLRGYVIQPLSPGVVVERKIVDIDAFSQSLRQALAKLRPATRDAAVAVPASAVIRRTIDMDANLSDEEMEGQVLLEAEQYIPYPLAEVAIDFARRQGFALHGGSGHEGQIREQVLLTACRKDNVESRVDAFHAAGLVTRVVDLESHAMERASSLLPLGVNGVVAVVDIGATLTTLHVLRDGHSIHTREQPSGAQQSMEAVVRQVERALQLSFSSGGCDRVDRIILVGGVATTPGLAESISKRLGIHVTIADPFVHLVLAPGIDRKQLRVQAPALMSACGLAMRAR